MGIRRNETAHYRHPGPTLLGTLPRTGGAWVPSHMRLSIAHAMSNLFAWDADTLKRKRLQLNRWVVAFERFIAVFFSYNFLPLICVVITSLYTAQFFLFLGSILE
jgi:hypothetical protein